MKKNISTNKGAEKLENIKHQIKVFKVLKTYMVKNNLQNLPEYKSKILFIDKKIKRYEKTMNELRKEIQLTEEFLKH